MNEGQLVQVKPEILCKNGDIKTIKMLIEHGTKLSNNPNYSIFIIYAAIYNQKKIIKYLLQRQEIDVNIVDGDGNTALMHAINKGNTYIAQRLVEKRAKLNKKNGDGQTALMIACMKGQSVQLVEELIKAGADMEERNKGGGDALQIAYQNENDQIIRVLIQGGANIKKQEKEILSKAIDKENIELVKLLIEKKIDLEWKELTTSPILYAQYKKKKEIVKLLINAGVDINRTYQGGVTLVGKAALDNDQEILKELYKSERLEDENTLYFKNKEEAEEYLKNNKDVKPLFTYIQK